MNKFDKASIYILLSVPIIVMGFFIHEVGHYIAVIMFNGTIVDFYVGLDGGYVKHFGVATEYLWIVGIAGGLLQAVYYGILAKRITEGLYIPAFFSGLYAYLEDFWISNHTAFLSSNMVFASAFTAIFTFFVLILNAERERRIKNRGEL